jgi:hypothetical protein
LLRNQCTFQATYQHISESVLEIPCCFAGFGNPASFEAVLLLVGLDFLTPSVRTGVAIQASDKPISKHFLRACKNELRQVAVLLRTKAAFLDPRMDEARVPLLSATS